MAEHLDSLLLASSAQLAHYIDDILLQGHTESQVHKALETCVQHMKAKGWEVSSSKTQGLAQNVRLLDVQWFKGLMSLFHMMQVANCHLERWYNSPTDEQAWRNTPM